MVSWNRHVKRQAKIIIIGVIITWLCYSIIFAQSPTKESHVKNTADLVKLDKRIQPKINSSVQAQINRARHRLYSIPRPSDEKYAINETRGQTISLNREIPDNRPLECLSQAYNISLLPTISVIIPMYNEAPSILLRTVHSILNRTPSQLLSDIIIVDDMSTNENMNDALTEYIDLLGSKVRILRLKKKAHLIRARMAGASIARGEVLLFQDGHTEMNKQWAEPLLDYIRLHPKTIVQPQVDSIDQWTIEYENRDSEMRVWRGVFLWDMRYAWHKMPAYYHAWTESAAEPVPCPVLVGCSIAVTKKYFEELGGFDIGLDVWGGEQIELSFRAWMCGGRIVIHPCSLTGHVFKPWMKSDLNWKARETALAKNNIRVAESWMEGYSSYYYASNWIYDFKRVELTPEDLQGIQERRALKERLKCKSFKWYLENILPELIEPPAEATFHGELNNKRSNLCIRVADDDYLTLTRDCYMYSRLNDQSEFSFTNKGRLMYRDKCIKLNRELLQLTTCHSLRESDGTINFELLPGRGMHQGKIHHTSKSGEIQCLEQVTNILSAHYKEQMPQFMKCNMSNDFQVWNINYHFDYSLVPKPHFKGDTRNMGKQL